MVAERRPLTLTEDKENNRHQQTKQLTTKHGSFISIQYYPFNLSPLMSTSWMKTHVDNNITKRRVLYPYIDSGGQVRTTVWKFFQKVILTIGQQGGQLKTSQELRILSRSLSDCKSLLLNVMIHVSQFVSNSQLCH